MPDIVNCSCKTDHFCLRSQSGMYELALQTTGGKRETRTRLVYVYFFRDFAAIPHCLHLFILCQHFISIFITALEWEIASHTALGKVFLLKIQLPLIVITLVRRVNQFKKGERPWWKSWCVYAWTDNSMTNLCVCVHLCKTLYSLYQGFSVRCMAYCTGNFSNCLVGWFDCDQ